MASADAHASTRGSAVLTIGFGISVGMWLLGYLFRLPPALAPSWLLALGLLACPLAAGFLAGRWGALDWRSGLACGLLSSTINLLILGSLLGGPRANQVAPSALWWVPGSLLLGAGLCAIGAAAGARRSADSVRPLNWTGIFAATAAAATLVQLLVGGLVTSNAAGLAVVDWPNSFGYNMFLYPLSRMTGGIYYEHAHRLFGSLVGLTTVALALHLLRVERRGWVKRLGLLAVLLVVVQGVLGGLRVTGGFTLATSPAAMAPSITLAIVHGVLGPAFFALVAALAVFTSSTWMGDQAPSMTEHASGERRFGFVLAGALLVQLVLGAIQRHLARGLLVHITFAVIVLVLAVVLGARLWGLYGEQRLLQRLGRILMVLAGVQVALGVLALIAVSARVEGAPREAWQVLLTTAHQGTGAALFGAAVIAWLWTFRLLIPVPDKGSG